MKYGANVNAIAEHKTSPLQTLVCRPMEVNKNVTERLIEFGANVNFSNEHGQTALHTVAKNGDMDIITLLVKNGANVNAIEQGNITPILLAVMEGIFLHFNINLFFPYIFIFI